MHLLLLFILVTCDFVVVDVLSYGLHILLTLIPLDASLVAVVVAAASVVSGASVLVLLYGLHVPVILASLVATVAAAVVAGASVVAAVVADASVVAAASVTLFSGLKDKHLLVTITSDFVVVGTDSSGLYGVHLLLLFIWLTNDFVVVDVLSYGLHILFTLIPLDVSVVVASVVVASVVVASVVVESVVVASVVVASVAGFIS